MAHTWPGNVRELKNVIQRAATVVRANVIAAADLSFVATDRSESRLEDMLDGQLEAATEALEREMIRRAMAACGGNRTAAARRLGMHRQLLYVKLKRYGIE